MVIYRTETFPVGGVEIIILTDLPPAYIVLESLAGQSFFPYREIKDYLVRPEALYVERDEIVDL